MARGIDTFLQGVGAGMDPVAQAVGIYSQLKGVDRADREMALREAEGARAERADVRAAEAARLSGAATQQGIDIAAANQKFTESERAKKQEQQEAYADYQVVLAGGRLAPDRLVRLLNYSKGLPGAGADLRQALAKWGDSYRNILDGMQAFAQDREALGQQGRREVVYDPNNPATKKMFEDLDRVMGPGRAGRTFTYPGSGTTGGYSAQTMPLTRGGKVVFLRGPDGRPKVTVEFALADPQTGEPLKMNGQQLYAPATKMQSNDPQDQVVLRDIGEVMAIAATGEKVTASLAKQIDAIDREELTKAALAEAVRTGNPDAISEAQRMRERDSVISMIDKALPNAKNATDRDRLAWTRQVLLDGGDPKTAMTVVGQFLSPREAREAADTAWNREQTKMAYSRETETILQNMRAKESEAERQQRSKFHNDEVQLRIGESLFKRESFERTMKLEEDKLEQEKAEFAENRKIAWAKLRNDEKTLSAQERNTNATALREVGDAYSTATRAVETAYTDLTKIMADRASNPAAVEEAQRRVRQALADQLERRDEYRAVLGRIEPALAKKFSEGGKSTGGLIDEGSFTGSAEGYGQGGGAGNQAEPVETRAPGVVEGIDIPTTYPSVPSHARSASGVQLKRSHAGEVDTRKLMP